METDLRFFELFRTYCVSIQIKFENNILFLLKNGKSTEER